MARYGVILHDTDIGSVRQRRTFASKSEAKKFARALAKGKDITANAAVFDLASPEAKEWLF